MRETVIDVVERNSEIILVTVTVEESLSTSRPAAKKHGIERSRRRSTEFKRFALARFYLHRSRPFVRFVLSRGGPFYETSQKRYKIAPTQGIWLFNYPRERAGSPLPGLFARVIASNCRPRTSSVHAIAGHRLIAPECFSPLVKKRMFIITFGIARSMETFRINETAR